MTPSLPAHELPLILVGASTGGPGALRQLLRGLGRDHGAAVVIAQHMPDTFSVMRLAAQLAEAGAPVEVARNGSPLRPDRVLIARPGLDLALDGDGDSIRVSLTRPRAVDGRPRPNVDHLFDSGAELCRAGFVNASTMRAIVLSGMGRDGARGATRLARLGAIVRVQDEPSSSVWGMPRAVLEAKAATEAAEPELLGVRLRRELLGRIQLVRAS